MSLCANGLRVSEQLYSETVILQNRLCLGNAAFRGVGTESGRNDAMVDLIRFCGDLNGGETPGVLRMSLSRKQVEGQRPDAPRLGSDSVARLLEAVPTPCAYVDADFVFRFANELYARTHGKTSDQIIGHGVSEVCGPLLPEIRPRIEAALRGEPQQFEIKHQPPGGGRQWLRVSYVPDGDTSSGIVGIFVFIRDISERKKLEKRHAQFRYACDQSMEGFALHDKRGHFTYVNSAQAEMYGYSPEEVIGESWRMFYESEVADSIENEHFPILERDGFWRGELKGRRKSGEVFDVEVALTVLIDEDGGHCGLSCNCRDVTERNVTERTVRRLGRLEALGQLTGGVAHDFNNLLSVVIGNLDLLRRVLDDDSGNVASTMARDALHAAQRGAALTHRLLAFARKQPLSPRVIDPRELVEGMRNLIERSVGERVEIQMQHEPGPWRCLADGPQLENAVLNLVLNARDAMPDGGVIKVRTANVETSTAPGGPNGQYTAISVEDSGFGMTEAVRERIFDPFFTTKESGKGNGLGLSIVHGFVAQSGGRLEVVTTPGIGSTISILLPRTNAREPFAGSAGADSVPSESGQTALVIDDEPEVLSVVALMLKQLGFSVLEASNGEQAVRTAHSHPEIDIILSDVALPGSLTGPALIDEIRCLLPAAQGLLMSGYADKGEKLKYEVLSKPFTMKGLAKTVQHSLKSSRQATDHRS